MIARIAQSLSALGFACKVCVRGFVFSCCLVCLCDKCAAELSRRKNNFWVAAFFTGKPIGSCSKGKVMSAASPQEITALLAAWGSGDQAALDQLMPLVYDELRRMAHRYLGRERAGHTLQSAALVNEAYLKLLGERQMDWQNRAHFFAVAAQAMRQILVDYARTRNRDRRGGGAQRVSLEDALAVADEQSAELVALDDALNDLAAFDQRKSKVAELRFFGGLSVEETAAALQVAPVTVMREWRLAKAWLYRELNREADEA